MAPELQRPAAAKAINAVSRGSHARCDGDGANRSDIALSAIADEPSAPSGHAQMQRVGDSLSYAPLASGDVERHIAASSKAAADYPSRPNARHHRVHHCPCRSRPAGSRPRFAARHLTITIAQEIHS